MVDLVTKHDLAVVIKILFVTRDTVFKDNDWITVTVQFALAVIIQLGIRR
jgi:hypothetical protein